jgi:type II secretory pathway pseudopilin PulG
MIEMLAVIVIVMILLLLTIAVTTMTRKHAAIMTTRHTLAIIHQALLHYKEATGDFPESKTSEINWKSVLTSQIKIKDYKGDILKTVDPVFSETEFDSLVEERIVDDKGQFLDGWANPILYFYVEVNNHPYASKCVPEGGKSYNVNWTKRHFDLISQGSDGQSTETNLYTQKDDLTNFT